MEKVYIAEALIFFGLVFFVGASYQSCSVMSQCENGLNWRPWPPEIERGYPGKRGPAGPRGERGAKGEPGRASGSSSPSDNEGPTREFLGHTMTYDTGRYYCQSKGRRLCRGNEICIHEGKGRRMIDDVIEGDHWTPILDGPNKWLQIGDSRRFTCYTHTETHSGAMASWGNTHNFHRHTGYVYCCGRKYERPRYRYIGKTATYDKAKKHCVDLGKRLCRSSELCYNTVPVYGTIARDAWAPVNDRNNEWVQIGNVRTCSIYSLRSGAPSWGTRTDGSEKDYLGFLLCC